MGHPGLDRRGAGARAGLHAPGDAALYRCFDPQNPAETRISRWCRAPTRTKPAMSILEIYQTQYGSCAPALWPNGWRRLRLHDSPNSSHVQGARSRNGSRRARAGPTRRRARVRIREAADLLLHTSRRVPGRLSRLVNISFGSPDPAFSKQVSTPGARTSSARRSSAGFGRPLMRVVSWGQAGRLMSRSTPPNAGSRLAGAREHHPCRRRPPRPNGGGPWASVRCWSTIWPLQSRAIRSHRRPDRGAEPARRQGRSRQRGPAERCDRGPSPAPGRARGRLCADDGSVRAGISAGPRLADPARADRPLDRPRGIARSPDPEADL